MSTCKGYSVWNLPHRNLWSQKNFEQKRLKLQLRRDNPKSQNDFWLRSATFFPSRCQLAEFYLQKKFWKLQPDIFSSMCQLIISDWQIFCSHHFMHFLSDKSISLGRNCQKVYIRGILFTRNFFISSKHLSRCQATFSHLKNLSMSNSLIRFRHPKL